MEAFNSDQLLKLFTQFALKEGSSTLLSNEGLKSLLQSHFSNLLGSMTLNDMVKYADFDKDGRISFEDFKSLITKLIGFGGLSNLSNLTGLLS